VPDITIPANPGISRQESRKTLAVIIKNSRFFFIFHLLSVLPMPFGIVILSGETIVE